MSKYKPMQSKTGPANGSTLTLVATTLNKVPNTSRRFNLTDDEQAFNDYLLREPLPDLIVKIIGTNNGQTRDSLRPSIQNAFKQVICTLMEQTNILLLNGTLAMIDLEECDTKVIEIDERIPNVIICEPFGKSRIFIYHSTTYQFIDQILSQTQKFSEIPIITLLIQGDTSSVTDIVENITKHIPTIILKGTGLIANQIAAIYEPIGREFRNRREGVSNEQTLSNTDLRRLTHINDKEQNLIRVCQPGKDELDDSILGAIAVAIGFTDTSRARISELNFAMQWSKIDYAQSHILNHNTIIDWTNDELDICLESAISLNAVTFVELLFEYGASLQRLALISKLDCFKIESTRKQSHVAELMIASIPMVVHLGSDKRVKAYLRHLFNWAVENQYFELVMSICTRLEDSIIAMLLVSQWCRYQEQIDFITATNYNKHCQQFEMYAADILDLYYADNEEQTIEFLNEKSVLYQDQQPSVLIDDLSSKELLSTKCIQFNANTTWYGTQFHKEKSCLWETLICLVCFCPLLLLIPLVRNRVLQWDSMDDIEQQRKGFCNSIRNKFEIFGRFFRGNATIRFHYSLASYATFLLLFSYTILFDYFPLNIYEEKRSHIYRLPIPITELVVHVFLASIALEEIRQVFLHVKSVLVKAPYWKELAERNRHRNTIWSFYKNDPWNVLDFFAFTLWIVGFATRFIVKDHAFEVSKICMSLDLCLWYMRCLHVFLASERLGPKLLMIFHTMKDLMSFLFFIVIFLFAYTTTTYSLITTSSYVEWSDSTHFTTKQDGGNLTKTEIFRNLIEWGTWKIFGSTSLTTSDSVAIKYTAKNDAYGFVTLMLTITFLIIAYVLLLNNLIALFNFTIQRVHGESHRAWCYHFYVVLKEYEEKDMFVPPFNLLLWPLSYCMRKNFDNKMRNDTFIQHDNQDKKHIRRHQQKIAEKYWKEKQVGENGIINRRPYVCRQCKLRGTEADYIESTFL